MSNLTKNMWNVLCERCQHFQYFSNTEHFFWIN